MKALHWKAIVPVLVVLVPDHVAATNGVGHKFEVVPDEYIVVFNSLENGSETARQKAERLIRDAERHTDRPTNQDSLPKLNVVNFVYERTIRGFSGRLAPRVVDYLRNRPEVKYIVPDGYAYGDGVQSPVPTWGLDRIDQRDLPLNNSYIYYQDGLGVHAYILDSGIRATHSDFFGRVGNGYDFIDNDADPADCHGHGTHVAGTLAGATFGVAKKAQIHAVRVLGCDNRGRFSQITAGVDWVAAYHVKPAVANMSLGGDAYAPLDEAVLSAIQQGVTFFISAGNNNTDACQQSPARVTTAITVASSTETDQRSAFSNFGACVDLFAPGSAIVSAWYLSDTATAVLSGTSMASPHVAGVGALYLQVNPAALPDQVAQAVVSDAGSANKIGDAGQYTPNVLLYSLVLPPSEQPIDWLPAILDLVLDE